MSHRDTTAVAAPSALKTSAHCDRFTHKLLFPEKVSDLIEANKGKVAKVLDMAKKQVAMKPELAEAAKRAPLDELYALRFVLSAKNDNIDVVVAHLIETLEWRAPRLDALDAAKDGRRPNEEIIRKHSHVAVIGLLGDLHPVALVRAGRSSPKNLFNELNLDQLVENQLFLNEQIFRLCDAKTRETGLLCKQVAVIDLEGFSVFNFDSRFSKVIGKASTLSAVYYPQMLGKTVIINMPVTFRFIYKAMSVFMPASTLEKQALCPANTVKRSATECPFLRNFSNGVQIMPPFLGGTGEMLPEFVLDRGS
jgi:hypothetical protein